MVPPPTRKELLGYLQIGIGLLAIWNYFVIDLFETPLYDYQLFEHQCISISLGFMGLFHGLGTWFWYSNLAETRMMVRIHSMLVYFTLMILMLVTRYRYKAHYGPLIRGFFDHDVFDNEDDRMENSILLFSVILMLIGIYFVVQINYMIIRRKMKQQSN